MSDSQLVIKATRGGKRPGAGRPAKVVESAQTSILLELFDSEAEKAIVANMIAIASSRLDRQSVTAATWLWDRVYGTVKTKTESHHTIDVTRLSDDELERLVKGS
jgi:hypothetical protein